MSEKSELFAFIINLSYFVVANKHNLVLQSKFTLSNYKQLNLSLTHIHCITQIYFEIISNVYYINSFQIWQVFLLTEHVFCIFK